MDSDMNIEVKFQLFGENVKTLECGWAVSVQQVELRYLREKLFHQNQQRPISTHFRVS